MGSRRNEPALGLDTVTTALASQIIVTSPDSLQTRLRLYTPQVGVDIVVMFSVAAGTCFAKRSS